MPVTGITLIMEISNEPIFNRRFWKKTRYDWGMEIFMEHPPVVKIEIFIPADYLEALGEVLSRAGAGRIGNYDRCMSIINVTGTWRPLEHATPFLGEIGKVCRGSELKVEVNCAWELVPAALAAIHAVHPYEEPVINVVPLLNHLF
jgi:hypothetical protein